MGLFSSKKNPCVICGEATPLLLAKSACGGKLCSDCAKAISMEDELFEEITLEELRDHLAYREKNAELHETFTETRVIKYAAFDKIYIDDHNQLFYLSNMGKHNAPIFRFDELESVAYVEMIQSRFEDKMLELKGEFSLFGYDEKMERQRGTRVVKFCSRAGRQAQDSFYEILYDEYHNIMRSKNFMANLMGIDDKLMESDTPVEQMYVLFTLNNPYWRTYRENLFAPSIPQNNDDRRQALGRYLDVYKDQLEAVDRIMDAMASILEDSGAVSPSDES